MISDFIKKFSSELSKEVSERKIYDVDEISNLISVRINDSLQSFIENYYSEYEKEYNTLLTKQKNYKVGHSEYIMLGYELSRVKNKIKKSNQIINNIGKKDGYSLLRQFITKKYGDKVMEEFLNEYGSHESFLKHTREMSQEKSNNNQMAVDSISSMIKENFKSMKEELLKELKTTKRKR